MNAKNSTIRKGDIVRVTREKKYNGKEDPLTVDTQPTIGRVVFAHPLGTFYVVEFRDRYTAEYKPMYRQSFWPEHLEKITQPNFMAPRSAKKRSWAK